MTLDLISYKNIVEDVLKNNVHARKNDKVLTFLVWRRFSPVFIPFEDFKKLPMPETLSRIRRKLQNEEKKFLPSDSILAKRNLRENEVKTWATSKI